MIALVCLTFSGGQAQNTGMWWISMPNFFTYADGKWEETPRNPCQLWLYNLVVVVVVVVSILVKI